jgi:interferon-induced transmembrane protein/caspase domain-containing protein
MHSAIAEVDSSRCAMSTGQFPPPLTVELLAGPDADVSRGELVAMAGQLRADLIAAGVTWVEPAPARTIPPGARAIELVMAAGLLVSLTQAASQLTTIVDFLQRWRSRDPRRQQLMVTVDGVDVAGPASRSPTHGQATATTQHALTRSALIVATAAYRDPALSQLRSPGRDAQALAAVLGDGRIGGFSVDLVTDADEWTIRRRLSAFFADRRREDLLLVHFSCHGLKDQRGRLYLAAADTELRALSATAVPASFLADLMSESASQRIVLILDCCYSGAFTRGVTMRGDRNVHLVDEFGGGTGRTVLTASSATEYAFEGTELTETAVQPSVFTSAIVAGLQNGEADLNHDGEITIDELYDFAYHRVHGTGTGQEPMKWSFGMTGSVVVARSARPAALPPHVLADLSSDRVALRVEAVTALAAIAATGGAGLREAALGALLDLRDRDDSARVRRAAADALTGRGVPYPFVPETPQRQETAPPRTTTPEPPRSSTPPLTAPAPPQHVPTPHTPPPTWPQGPGAPPQNYLALAIVATILCCFPLGIVAIVKARKVNSLWAAGDHAAARKTADDARKYAILTMVVGAVVIVLYVVVVTVVSS